LTDAILAATSGKSCARCHERLLAFDAGGLRAAERELVELHLEHCEECRGMAQALAWLKDVFPAMAEEEPGEECIAAILARTSLAPRGIAGLWRTSARRLGLLVSGPAIVLRNLQARWQQALRRPLFPLEAAYVATLVVVLLAGTPLSPFHSVAKESLNWLKGESQTTVLAGVPLPQDLQPLAGEALDRTFTPAQRQLRKGKSGLLQALATRSEAWSGAHELMDGVGDLFSAVTERENAAVAPALQDINDGFHHIWRGLRHPRSPEDPAGFDENSNPELPRQGANHE
jgi:hypothetical protein